MGDFVDFYCLCRLLQPLSTFTAFVGLHCLCLIFLPLSAITAFINFYCLCRLALPVSDFAVVVGYADFDYWMSKLADRINYSALKLDFRIPTNSVAVKRQVLASVYIYIYIYVYTHGFSVGGRFHCRFIGGMSSRTTFLNGFLLFGVWFWRWGWFRSLGRL